MFSISQYTIAGKTFIFKISALGVVLDGEGNVICETGGQVCLNAYLEELKIKLQVTTVAYTINGVKTIFVINSSGKVIKQDGTVICETGGQVCLEKWVQSQLF